jgi:hypothetical protein
MKQLKIILIAGGFLLLISSCSNPLNKKFNFAKLKADATEIKESKKVPPEDLDILGSYISSSIMKGRDLEGKTYG